MNSALGSTSTLASHPVSSLGHSAVSYVPSKQDRLTASEVVVQSLIAAGVKHLFCVSGAKINGILNAIVDYPDDIQIVVCHHEQNAAFMAGAVGRLTGRPGCCLVTSGPGVANLCTGLATAHDENSPLVAIGGDNARSLRNKHTHQALLNVEIMRSLVKQTFEILDPVNAAEVMCDAFRVASAHPQGPVFVSIPTDVGDLPTTWPAFESKDFIASPLGPANSLVIEEAARTIGDASKPVILIGQRGNSEEVGQVVVRLAQRCRIPIVETFQGAAGNSRDLDPLLYFGRVSLWRNQAGDHLIRHADTLITIGYDPVEYDAIKLTRGNDLVLINIDYCQCSMDQYFRPNIELVGDICSSLEILLSQSPPMHTDFADTMSYLKEQCTLTIPAEPRPRVHPLKFIAALQELVDDDTVVTVDVGSVYIWMSRFFKAYRPRRLQISNGQQTLGVALPWAIASSLLQPVPHSKKTVSVSGDGGFLFSAAEMATAVQHKCNITHFVFKDGAYDMVSFQQDKIYGRHSGVELADVDFVKLAEALGATAWRVSEPSELFPIMKKAMEHQGVALVEIAIDYSDCLLLSLGELGA